MASTCLPVALCGNVDEEEEEEKNKHLENHETSNHHGVNRAVFDTWDANKDGVLTAEELCAWMQRMGLHITQQGVEEIIATSGLTVGNGGLDFESFRVLEETLDSQDLKISTKDLDVDLKNKGTTTNVSDNVVVVDEEDDIRKAFNVFDKNGDGLISPMELQSTLSDLGLLSTTMSFSRIHSMIRRVDIDDDGFVDYDEFKSMLKNG